MRVAHYRESFSPLSETFIYEYYAQHLATGIDAAFYTFKRVDPAGRPAKNVNVLRLPSRLSAVGVWGRLYGRVPTVARTEGTHILRRAALHEALALDRPEVIHAHFGNTGWVAHTAAKTLGIPSVVSFYGYDASELPRKKLWRKRFQLLFKEAGAILALSEEMKAALIKLGAPEERTHIVHLARDLSLFPFQQKVPPLRRFLSVGRLVEKKGHEDAIAAIGRLVADGRDVTLDIIGDGPLEGELRKLIASHNLNDGVRLLGPLPNLEVMQAMRDADAFILCSKTAKSGDKEGTPTVLIEAQAMGLPCISTVHAGIPEMFPPAFRSDLAPEGDVNAIARAVAGLIDLPVAQLQERTRAARAHMETEFSIEQQAARLVSIYEQAIAKR